MKIYYVRESFLQSLASDAVTYGGLLALIATNYYLLGNSTFWSGVLCVMFFVISFGKVADRSKQYRSRQELIEELVNELAEEDRLDAFTEEMHKKHGGNND